MIQPDVTAQVVEIEAGVIADLQTGVVMRVATVHYHVVSHDDRRVERSLFRDGRLSPVIVGQVWPVVVMQTEREDLACAVTEQSTALQVATKDNQTMGLLVVDSRVSY